MYKTEKPEDYKKIPNQKDHDCFACSPINESGLKLKFYTDETYVFSWFQIPNWMAGWNKITHGGILATVLDETMAWSCIYLKKSFILTRGMQVEYIRPVRVETPLYSVGWITLEKDGNADVASIIYDDSGKPCNKGKASIKLFTPSEIRKTKIFDEEFINSFEKNVLNQF